MRLPAASGIAADQGLTMEAFHSPTMEDNVMTSPTASSADNSFFNCSGGSSSSAAAEVDSDTEDDPGHLLNLWLGELNTLKKGLDISPTTSSSSQSTLPPVVKRREQKLQQNVKNQYRCSLINLEETQDDELDAILGELSVLESQFEEEIAGVDRKMKIKAEEAAKAQIKTNSNAPSPSESDTSNRSSGMHSRSSSGSVEGAPKQHQPTMQNGFPTANTVSSTRQNGQRTESPDNDSAFCDNLSVLSSCSASSSSRTDQSKSSSSGVSSTASPTSQEDQEARIKAEKIKLAIEKIKEASIKKLFIKVFTADGSAKSLLIDEKMSVGYVTRILAEKNHVKLDPKWTIVELVPDLYMERVYEDHENLVENCLMWKVDSKNTLWFIERPEKYDILVRPEVYLLGSSSSQKGDLMEEHTRRELLEEYFSGSGVGAPEVEGFIWLKAESKKSWKKFYFVLRSSGLYYAPKGKKTSKDLVCLSTFDVNQVYYGAGWRRKYKSPTDFCFAIKHPQIQAKTPKYIRYLCVDTERELHQWVTGIRIAKNGRQVYENYRAIEEEITHADIDILTSKRFSVNSPNSLQIPSNVNGISVVSRDGFSGESLSSPARTPSSENKSLDSALSSGIVSDMSELSTIPSSSASSQFTGNSDSSETGSSQQHTPVNTIDRGLHDGFRRSMSRSSKSSSSSGCLSDKSSLPGGNEQGFESDFPAGGTIKKRPSVNPRIPLTSTTWGLVRDSDEDINDPNAPNVRVGGGGTLLRSAVRHSMRKSSQQMESLPQQLRCSNGSLESDGGQQQSSPVRHHVLAEVHREYDDIDQLSAEFESNLNNQYIPIEDPTTLPLPPPPPREVSLDRLSTVTTEDLPPPPPEIYEESASHYHVSSVHTPNRPPLAPTLPRNTPPFLAKPVPSPLPPSLKRNTPSPGLTPPKRTSSIANGNAPNGTRRISFDDNVQLIGEDAPMRSPIPVPNKLYGHDANSNAAPPKEFLSDLQRVMNKKWQIAEKCREDLNATPHQVLGFRDEQVQHLNGPDQCYSRDDCVGAWVLQSQQFNGRRSPSPPPPPPAPATHKCLPSEPLYAIAKKHPTTANRSPSHYAPGNVNPNNIMHQQNLANIHQRPVILREPTPEYDPYATLNEVRRLNNGYHHHHPEVANFSTLNFAPCPSPPLSMSPAHRDSFRRSNGSSSPISKLPAPPPPRRSENTHLTTKMMS